MQGKEEAALAQRVIDNIEGVLKGKRAQIELALAAVVAGGHVLIEDVPGLGKTMLARALAISIGLSYKRIQFTADLMPSDILGGPVYNPKDGSFALRPGPVFSHVVLADEINRANPRAQSALLECMEEGQVTLDGQTLRLPAPFAVIATQNPIDMAGTYPLPEAQLDRFLVRLSLGYPDAQTEAGLIHDQQFIHPIQQLQPVCDAGAFARLAAQAQQVSLTPEIAGFIAGIVSATRQHPGIRAGASPRGTLGLARVARALSCIRGRDYVDPAIVREAAPAVLAHRLVLQNQGAPGKPAASLVEDILQNQRTPR
ncbi:AAA family ATPase [Paracidovorax avenae]|uniref:AAA family ATPase n=1 Tax=Paracidovorax avenae TaxID=80867 RepID=UPI000D172BFB|nr:MoxR family ATPase [Paracidovorax avenae]AVS81696.1 AAA family ATPase [Paracidovorax avenae]AVS90555.1 AAA family ATPase [Paracidovorax avenae]AVT06413.1 AAA family ATPase [Paracidovorax avenae]AVT16837.1 AAA family ATPase [Paracidovorax avenae]